MEIHDVIFPEAKVRKSHPFNGQLTKGTFRNQQYSEILLLWSIVIDVLLLNSILIGFISAEVPLFKLLDEHLYTLLKFLMVVNLTGAIVASFSNVYSVFEGVRVKLNIKSLFWSILVFFGIVSLVYDQLFFPVFENHFLIPSMVTFSAVSFLSHMGIRYYNRDKTSRLPYAVVGGRPSHLKYLTEVMNTTFGDNADCLGYFSDSDIPGLRKIGDFKAVEGFISEDIPINKLLYINSTLSLKEVQRISQLCRNHLIDFEVVPIQMDFFEKGTQIEQLAHLPILRRKKEPLCLVQNQMLKRTFDIVFSLLVIVLVFSWLFPLIALLIRLESKGPIFFVQYRTGYWNKPFRCLKFRSMRVNNECDAKQAEKEDSRITKIGAFLRKKNLDELPQFINVLKGDMSIVGPRPHMIQHTEDYSKLIDKFMIRHEVKPGITGWAQVSGWRGPTEEVYKMEKRVEYDVNYIENWSFWFDCKCIFLTVFNMVKGEDNAF